MHYNYRREALPARAIELNTWTVTWPGATAPLPARVPGYAQHDMFDAGLLPDPFPGTNEAAWQPACDQDHTYECTFDAPSDLRAMERLELVFDGIDTVATITLNNEPLAAVDNMFRTWRFDVRGKVQESGNVLRVAIQNPRRVCAERQEKYKERFPRVCGAAHLRKMQCSYGWDWGIKLPMSGIWKPVRLEGWNTARIARVSHETTEADARSATIKGCVTFDRANDTPVSLVVSLISPAGAVMEHTVALAGVQDSASFAFTVAEPALWWPNGQGNHPLYTLRVTLCANNETISACERRIGIRTIAVVRTPDQHGESFYFRVNGVPVFAKGANWIPSDAILSRLTAADYHRLIGSAAAANMNMLRVWGGGFYEHDEFYSQCDEFGIMVWQDIMFACHLYPVHGTFMRDVGDEVQDTISRLGHHPCVALWCGNNEVEQAIVEWSQKPPVQHREYKFLFEEYLAGVVHTADPSRLYWPSSPHAPGTDAFYRQDCGDTHYWEVWHGGKPFEAYLERNDRFMSEFGFQSFPDIHTVQRYTQPADHDLESPVMKHHQRSGDFGNPRIKETVATRYGLPTSFADQLILSQIAQAEAIRMGVEHWRRNALNQQCMGTLYWQLNDNWPVASWSSVDYYGRWKALHYEAARFYAPLLVTAHLKDEAVHVTVMNDQPGNRRGRVRWQVRTYAGKLVNKGIAKAVVPPTSALSVCSLPMAELVAGAAASDCYLVADWHDGQGDARTIAHFTMLKDATLRDPGLELKVEGTTLTVTARKFAKCVCIDAGHEAVQCSDNYFDLLPRESRTVKLVLVKPGTDMPPVQPTVRSLWQMTRDH